MSDESELERGLVDLLNRHSAENDSDTPDFILAAYLMACLRAFNLTIQRRKHWYHVSDEDRMRDECEATKALTPPGDPSSE